MSFRHFLGWLGGKTILRPMYYGALTGARSVQIHDLSVRVLFESSGIEQALGRLEAALDLIAAYSPWVLARARRANSMLLLAPYRSSGPVPGSRMILVPQSWLTKQSATWVAASLVSEFCAARLYARPCSPGTGFRRTRLLFEKKLSFARRIPNSIELVEHLTMIWDSGAYEPGHLNELRRAGLREVGAPDWLTRLLTGSRQPRSKDRPRNGV
jgi:hypothetical protein